MRAKHGVKQHRLKQQELLSISDSAQLYTEEDDGEEEESRGRES